MYVTSVVSKDCVGFVAFSMLRRDSKAKGHGVVPLGDGEANYQSTTVRSQKHNLLVQCCRGHSPQRVAACLTRSPAIVWLLPQIWKDRASFDAWRTGSAFKAAHGSAPAPAGGPPAAGPGGSAKPIWSRPPSPVFYEAKLVISSPEGA